MDQSTPNASDDPVSPAPTAAVPKSNRSAMMIVFLVVVVDLLGFGIVLPLLPVTGEEYLKPLFPGEDQRVVRGMMIGLLLSSFSLMQFLVAPAWGRLSDRIGRRPVLLVGLVGSVVFYSLFGYAAGMKPEFALVALVLMFIARIGAGTAGATIATAQAVIADSTPPEKRKHGMALIGAAFGIGFTIGPIIGAMTMKVTNDPRLATSLTGYIAASLSLIALILAFTRLPETRTSAFASRSTRRIIDLSAWKMALTTSAIGPVVLTFFLATIGFGAMESTLARVIKDTLQIPVSQAYWLFAYVGFVLVLTQGFLYRRLAKKLSEKTFMIMGIALMSIGVVALGGVCYAKTADTRTWWSAFAGSSRASNDGVLLAAAATSDADLEIPEHRPIFGEGTSTPGFGWLLAGTMIALAVAVVGFAFLTPSAQALVSRRAPQNRQGEILGVNQSAAALARIIGPVFGNSLYDATVSHMLPYLFGAGLLVLMLPVVSRIKRD
jgi:MFS transporter, DHA1 family, tetracycline resistance protein